jgi:hypothetical protein
VNILAGEVVGVFAHIERADEHRAGRLQPLDQRRVLLRGRMRPIDLGAGDGRQPCDVEKVLDRERHAGERQARFVARGVERARAALRALGGDGGEGIECRIELGDARQRGVDNVGSTRLACANRLRNLGRCRPGEIVGHGSGLENRRRLRLDRQREFADQGGMLERDVEICFHRALPVRLQRQIKHARGGGDEVVEFQVCHGGVLVAGWNMQIRCQQIAGRPIRQASAPVLLAAPATP